MRVPAIVRKILNALNSHDELAVVKLHAPQVKVYDPAYPKPLVGHGCLKDELHELFRIYPDFNVKLLNLIIQGRKLAARIAVTGTHKPLLFATYKKVELSAAVFLKFNAKGLISEQWRYYDQAAMLKQLGLGLENLSKDGLVASPSERLKRIVVDILKVGEDAVTTEASFSDDFGIDSLESMKLAMAIEDEFHIKVPDDDLKKLITFGDAVAYIQKKSDAE